MERLDTDATVPIDIVAHKKERRQRPHYLEFTDPNGIQTRCGLTKDQLIIGRSDDSDLRLTSARASRHHAKVVRRGEEYSIYDNGSRNGIYLNGLKVHSAVLREGDAIQVGDTVFTYREG